MVIQRSRSVVAAGPRRLWRAPLLRPSRHRQFQDLPWAGRSRRRADFRAPRMQRREHGRRLCQGDRRADAGQRAFRPGADQRADRHRRGGEKPDAARGAGGRCADRSGEEQFLHRAGRDGARGRRGVGAAAYAELGARGHALRAVTRALRDRQTVVLSMPLDVQHATLASNLPPLELPAAPGRLHPDPRAVERLAEALARAQRPLILGGRGAVLSDAEPALVALADRLGALLATSVCGQTHPAAGGSAGFFRSASSAARR